MHNWPVILLVDDDTNDVLLFHYALEESPLHADLRVVRDGHEAVKYLSGYGVFANRREFPLPGIILLDLNMPGIDGLAVLRWMRRQRSLADLPVIVFTGSDVRQAEALAHGADMYMRKGEDTGELLALLQQINAGWQRNSGLAGLLPREDSKMRIHRSHFRRGISTTKVRLCSNVGRPLVETATRLQEE
jgi:CheY-like chemotaxis protein